MNAEDEEVSGTRGKKEEERTVLKEHRKQRKKERSQWQREEEGEGAGWGS